MATKIMLLLFGCSLLFSAAAQHSASPEYRNFPIVLTVQFNNLAMPFKDLKSNFSNVGFGIGTQELDRLGEFFTIGRIQGVQFAVSGESVNRALAIRVSGTHHGRRKRAFRQAKAPSPV